MRLIWVPGHSLTSYKFYLLETGLEEDATKLDSELIVEGQEPCVTWGQSISRGSPLDVMQQPGGMVFAVNGHLLKLKP